MQARDLAFLLGTASVSPVPARFELDYVQACDMFPQTRCGHLLQYCYACHRRIGSLTQYRSHQTAMVLRDAAVDECSSVCMRVLMQSCGGDGGAEPRTTALTCGMGTGA